MTKLEIISNTKCIRCEKIAILFASIKHGEKINGICEKHIYPNIIKDFKVDTQIKDDGSYVIYYLDIEGVEL